MSKTLLVIHHTPSPHTQEMFEAALAGATDPEIDGVDVVRRPALTVSPTDVLEADGCLLGTRPVWVLMVSGLLLARAGLFEELRTGGDGPTEPPG
jgi:hypothetical protein